MNFHKCIKCTTLDLSRKENAAPLMSTAEIQRSIQRSILNGNREEPKSGTGSSRKRLSVSEVSDMLFEFYKTKSANAPKQQQQKQAELTKYGQVSPTSAETLEPSSIAAIAVYGDASETASKNLPADEMMLNKKKKVGAAAAAASFHPGLSYTLKTAAGNKPPIKSELGCITAIPTSVLVANTSAVAQAENAAIITAPIGGSALVNKPQAAIIAEALMRNGLHSFQQQLRAQEILRHHVPRQQTNDDADSTSNGADVTPTKILENLLRKQQERDMRHSECENEPESSTDDEEESRYHAFDDIHLIEQTSNKLANNSLPLFATAAGGSHSMLEMQAQAFRNLEFNLSDYGGSSSNGSTTSPNNLGLDGEPVYECRHCGKKYRWKSTLRRHENVECGGKEPSHQCPYCPYKSKQRGNLGVHVRKHHTDLPQLPSKRRSKYSMKMCDGSLAMSGSLSDDSQGKLIIDCNK